MVPRNAIVEWATKYPWQRNEQVEQDLIICRALVAIFSDPLLSDLLAFKGGTAIHKLYFENQPRYSEDIDLVQVSPGPIKPILERLGEVLCWLPRKTIEMRRYGVRMRFRFDSEMETVVPLRLKVEINTCEHFATLGYRSVDFTVANQWFCGHCKLRTFALEEMLASKINAIYERRKGRDLFDLDYALQNRAVDTDSVFKSWLEYRRLKKAGIPSWREYIQNMEDKLLVEEYRHEVLPLLRKGIEYDPVAAWRRIRQCFIDRLQTERDREWLAKTKKNSSIASEAS